MRALFQALVCRALFPRVLRTLLSRVAIFKEYSVSFEEFSGEQLCIVRTWEENSLLDVCINVGDVGQRVPDAELSSLSRIVRSCGGELMPLSTRGGPQSFLRVLSDNRTDGRSFVYCREFTSEVFMQCYRQAHQEIVGMLEVTTTVDFLMLRLRPALQEPWLGDLVTLRLRFETSDWLKRVLTRIEFYFVAVRCFVFYLFPS